MTAEIAEIAEARQKLNRITETVIGSAMGLLGCQVGLLINFNVKMLKDGIRRLVNGIEE